MGRCANDARRLMPNAPYAPRSVGSPFAFKRRVPGNRFGFSPLSSHEQHDVPVASPSNLPGAVGECHGRFERRGHAVDVAPVSGQAERQKHSLDALDR
jgi:hypothetical protein